MEQLFLARMFAYSLLPLLLATGHSILDRQAHTAERRIEIFLMYLFGISVGANGLGGGFGHLFLSELVAEGIGWPAGSPFQFEMGFTNLALGGLGLVAVGRRDGFRTATILATTVIGAGATFVHLLDIAAHGNLASGNTIQNIGNLLDPVLLVTLTWYAARPNRQPTDNVAFLQWQAHQQPIIGMATVGIGMGFGIGYAVNQPLLGTLVGALLGVAAGIAIRDRTTPHHRAPISINRL